MEAKRRPGVYSGGKTGIKRSPFIWKKQFIKRPEPRKAGPDWCWRGAACGGSTPPGVLDVFMENGIGFDGVMGVSAGAVHGCSLVSARWAAASAIIKNTAGTSGS